MNILKSILISILAATCSMSLSAQTTKEISGNLSKTTISSATRWVLMGNVTLNGTVSVKSSLEIVNGTDGPVSITAGSKCSYMFNNSGTLTITGSKGKEIIIDGGAQMTVDTTTFAAPDKYAAPDKITYHVAGIKDMIAINSTGTLQLDYVTIQNVYGGAGDGAALFISTAQNILTRLTNCNISRCYAERGSAVMLGSSSKGAVNIEKSKITCCFSGGGSNQKTGGAIRTYGSTVSSLYLKNVTFRYNRALRIDGWKNDWERDGSGGAIFWNARGDANTICSIDGCRFERNASDDNGGAIKTQASIEFINNPTYISENVAPVGAGLYIEGYIGTVKTGIRDLYFNLSEHLRVTNNTAPSYQYDNKTISGLGAGVHFFFGPRMDLDKGSTITVEMDGSIITGNKTEGGEAKGGGIYFENSSIEGNYTFNIMLNSGDVSSNTSEGYGGGIYVYQGSVSYNKDKTGGLLSVTENESNQGAGIFIQTGNLEISNGDISSNIINGDGNGAGLYISGGRMEMADGTINGNKINGSGNGGGVYVTGDSSNDSIKGGFTMIDGAITNNVSIHGGGVYINNGNFIMRDGQISSNGKITDGEVTTVTQNGGGVYLDNGDFQLLGGSIDNNSATNFGGGVYLQGDNCVYTLTSGQINSNSAGIGGGVYLATGSFILVPVDGDGLVRNDNSSAQINSNSSDTNGGGVYIAGGTFTMNGGQMNTNTAQNGGGIYLNNGTMSITDGYIQGNIADNGGGVYITGQNGGMTMSGGNINANVANNNGGGAYITGSIEGLTMTGGNISGNKALGTGSTGGGGGGVFLNNGALRATAGNIKENTAATDGGGVYIMNGTVEMGAGQVIGNESGKYGGGVYVYNQPEKSGEPKSVSFDGGIIQNNKAYYGGGVCVNGYISLSVEEIQIAENKAVNGGGICLLNNAEMQFNSGHIINNRAECDEYLYNTTAYQTDIEDVLGIGGGVYLNSNTKLVFSEQRNLGLFGNFATNGADELFANGDGTTVNLPDVENMKLDGFPGGGDLKWIKDYIVHDTGYEFSPQFLGITGTGNEVYDTYNKDNNIRYRSLLEQNSQDFPQLHGGISQNDEYGRDNTYICFALGYEVIYIKLITRGLKAGESAVFKIEKHVESVKENSAEDDTSFRVIMTAQQDNETLTKDIAVTVGFWKITEEGWNWTYTLTPADGLTGDEDENEIEDEDIILADRSITKNISKSSNRRFVFENTKTVNPDDSPLNHETIVIKTF